MIVSRSATEARSIASQWATLLLLFLLAASPISAQSHSLEVSQYLHTSWTARDGFFRGRIASVAQTSDGYLWVATDTGELLRFDGVRFSEWKPPSSDSLLPKRLFHLLGSRDGSLWIAGIGLAELKPNGELRRYRQLDGTWIVGRLLEDKDGGIWAGGAGQPQSPKLCRFYHGESECFPPDSFLGTEVWALHEDRRGQLLACTKTGIWKLRPGSPEKLASMPAKLTLDSAFEEDANGALVFSAGDDIKTVTADGKVSRYPVEIIQAHALLKDQDGDLWFGTIKGIIHLHEGRTDRFTTLDGLSSNVVLDIFQDREKNLWVGTKSGLDKFTKPAVPSVTAKQGLSSELVNSVLTDRKGMVWVGTRDGLYKFDTDRVIKPTTKLPNGFVGSLFETSKGRTLVTFVSSNGPKGLAWFDGEGDKVSRLRVESGEDVFGVAEGSRGDLWVASREFGLLHLDENGKLIETFDDKILGEFGIALAYDPKRNGLWLTSRLGDLGFFKDGRFLEQYGTANGLGEGILRNPQVDSDGGVWVGTQVGLAHLRNGRISVLGRKNGLPCDAVHWMRHDKDHNVWLYTECGLVAFSENDLSSWITEPSHTIAILRYFDSTDGVLNSGFTGWYTPQAAMTSDGRILFSATGLSILDPSNLNQNTLPPPVHIEEITADDREFRGTGRVSLPPRVRSLHINFTALSFVSPRKVRFRYKLQNYDKDWSEPVSFREITYTNLPPGDYRFHVIASNNAGVWNDEGATLDFRIPPAWFQTIWFRAFSVALTIAMAWGIYRLRVTQVAAAMSARFDERLAERTRIARGLHDTLLQTIQGSKLIAVNALKNADDPVRTRRALEQLSEWLVLATDEGRAALQSLRTSTTESNDLAAGLRRALEDCRREPSMETTLTVSGDVREMHPIVRDEVYLIGYEAIRNAHTHSGGSRIDVVLTYSEDLSLSIRDDGMGIDSAIANGGKPGHFGLPSMRERADRIGAQLTIENAAKPGTEVKVLVPGSLAFRVPRPSPFDKVTTLFDWGRKN